MWQLSLLLFASSREPPRTPTDRVSTVLSPSSQPSLLEARTPRINLRPLASYYTLSYLLLTLLLIWIVDAPLWFVLLLILSFSLVYCAWGYYGDRPKHKKDTWSLIQLNSLYYKQFHYYTTLVKFISLSEIQWWAMSQSILWWTL